MTGRHDDLDGDAVADFAEWEREAHAKWLVTKLSRPVQALDELGYRTALTTPRGAAAPVAWGLDAAAPLSVAQIKAQGASFVCTYLAPYPSQSWKIRTPAEWKAYLDAGISIVANWESDGTPGTGWATGVVAAQQSQALLNDRGFPTAPVIFTFADSGAPNLALVLGAIQGAVSVLGWSRVGAYGGINTIAYLADRNACAYFWQCYAWSSGQLDGRAQLYQRLNGSTMDFDVAYATDYGQIPRPTGASPAPTPTPATYGELMQDKYPLVGADVDIWDVACGSASVDGRWIVLTFTLFAGAFSAWVDFQNDKGGVGQRINFQLSVGPDNLSPRQIINVPSGTTKARIGWDARQAQKASLTLAGGK